tara:strand:- start:9098 stop:11137 length:2040 start_codon:yes stop_codon:yes gene_type:complete
MDKSKTKKIKSSKTATGSKGDEIIISPKYKDKLDEAVAKTAVFSFGRYNPPTKGHELLVSKLRDIARKEKGIPLLFLSHSFDSKKNPIPYSDKIKLAMMAFGKDIVRRSRSNDIISVLKELSRDYDNVVIVAGSDRVPDYKRLEKYNGKDYKFKSFKVISAGTRDPDGDEVSAMSATKLRDAVKGGDTKKFKKGIATRLAAVSDMVFNMVRSGLQLAEELEQEGLLTEVLNIQQRRKRGIMMRRYKTKIARGRKIASKKMAGMAKLKKRSQRRAIQLVRKRLAGTRGANYRNLTPADKMAIDKRVSQKKAFIQKIAKRLMPGVRKGEQDRLARMRSKKKESVNTQFTNMIFEANFRVDITGLPTMYMQGSSATGVKTELRKLIKKPEENISGIEKVLPSEIKKAFRLKMMGKSEEEPIEEMRVSGRTKGDKVKQYSHVVVNTQAPKSRHVMSYHSSEKNAQDHMNKMQKHVPAKLNIVTKTGKSTKTDYFNEDVNVLFEKEISRVPPENKDKKKTKKSDENKFSMDYYRKYHSIYSEENPKVTAVKRKHERERDQLAIRHAREKTAAKVSNENYKVELTDSQLLFTIDKMMNEISKQPYDMLDEKAKQRLQDKSNKTNIDIESIISVYNEGVNNWNDEMNMNEQQAGYAHVNSFIANKKIEVKQNFNEKFTNFIKETKK